MCPCQTGRSRGCLDDEACSVCGPSSYSAGVFRTDPGLLPGCRAGGKGNFQLIRRRLRNQRRSGVRRNQRGPSATSTVTASSATSTTQDPSSSTSAPSSGDTPDAGVTPGQVPIFVAQGHMGRLTISCDLGNTWVANTSADDNSRCWEPSSVDCDHNSVAGRGLAYGKGYFVATWGWGQPGRVQRSSNGVDWETVNMGNTFADVAYGGGVFMANDHQPMVSTDALNWSDATDTDSSAWNVRAIEYLDHGTGRFLITAESGDMRDIVFTTDDGVTWASATTRPAECGRYVTGIAYGNGVAVIASGAGHICRSTDGGDTWTSVAVGGSLSSPPLWTGQAFMVWEGNELHQSADGVTWTAQNLVPSSVRIGSVARSDSGVFVATNEGWMVWYEEQKFYRSTDGVNWTTLPSTAYVGSHPINHIQFGHAEASAVCPVR